MPKPPRRSPPRRRHPDPVEAHPFADSAEYLDTLTTAVREHVETSESDDRPVDTDDLDYVPPHLRARRRRRRGVPPAWRAPEPDWVEPPFPSGRRRSPGAGDGASFRKRVAATRKANKQFPWPHEALATAAGIERCLALAVVITRAFEVDRLGVEYPVQTPEPEVIGELAGRLMGVRKDARKRIERSLRPGGDLVRRGLVRPPVDEDWAHHGPSRRFLLPRAVRCFVDGRATPLTVTRLVAPHARRPEEWMATRSVEQIRARASGQERARRLLAGPDLPSASLRLGPIDVAVPDGLAATGLPGALATLLERPVLDGLPRAQAPDPGRLELVAEATLAGAALLVEAEQAPSEGAFGLPHPLFGGPPGDARPWPSQLLVFRMARGAATPGAIPIEPPESGVRADVWRKALAAVGEAPPDEETLQRLAGLPLHPEQIVEAAANFVMAAGGVGAPGLLQTAGRGLRRDGPGVEVPDTRMKDVVLPAMLRLEAEQALAACRDWKRLSQRLARTAHGGYGRAPVLLFSGPPGTGKTRLAEATAGELGRPLRRLSGPDLRSCWYGEAEKQIRNEFRRADAAILFLDEVDAFLSNRGSGPQAHTDDRLANVLLEELERTDHTVVMATNRSDRLDAALARRVLFHLRFEAPGRAEREAIWRIHLPSEVDGAAGVDCLRLSRHGLNGGGIKNASWRAILRASRDEVALTHELVEEEAKREAARGSGRRGAGFGAGR